MGTDNSLNQGISDVDTHSDSSSSSWSGALADVSRAMKDWVDVAVGLAIGAGCATGCILTILWLMVNW